MAEKETSDSAIRDSIISTVSTEKPQTVQQLIELVQLKYPLTAQEITDHVMELQKEGRIRFTDNETRPATFNTLIFSSRAAWFWVTILLALTTTVVVFTVPEDAYPLVYLRYVLGSAFVLWLPGYTLTKTLFPAKDMDSVERIALSIGLSLALVPIVGLLLNYTPWGIRLAPITVSLLTITTIFATAAIAREYQNATRKATARTGT